MPLPALIWRAARVERNTFVDRFRANRLRGARGIGRAGILSLALPILLAACATPATPGLYKPRVADAAPTNSATTINRLARLRDPKVIAEPRGTRGNGPVYTVLGKSYRVMDSAKGFRQRGLASWYGTKFHGRSTSSGEPFDIYKLTAAHKHLPLPTFVRVTNLDNGKQTVVRVNDRGPFHGDRVIDLSYAAAVKLDFYRQGTANVLIEVLEPEPEAQQQYMVQAGAYRELARADANNSALKKLTGLPGVVVKTSNDGLFRVRLGPVPAGAELAKVEALLVAANYGKPRLLPVSGGGLGGR